MKRNAVKELKAKGIKKPSFFASLFGKKKIIDGQKMSLRARYDTLVNDKIEIMKDRQIRELAKAFEEDGKIYIGGEIGPDGIVRLGKARALDNKTLAELVNKQIEEYQKDAINLKKTKEQIKCYIKKANVFISNENKLRKMFADNPWEEIKATNDPKKLKELNEKATQLLENLLKRHEIL